MSADFSVVQGSQVTFRRAQVVPTPKSARDISVVFTNNLNVVFSIAKYNLRCQYHNEGYFKIVFVF